MPAAARISPSLVVTVRGLGADNGNHEATGFSDGEAGLAPSSRPELTHTHTIHLAPSASLIEKIVGDFSFQGAEECGQPPGLDW